SLLASGVSQKEKESSAKISSFEKRQILEKLKSTTINQGEIILAKALDLKIKTHDRVTNQQDESVRAEMTFTKEELEEIDRAKSLLSHQIQNPQMSDLFMFLVRDLLKRKDPVKRKDLVKTTKTCR